MNRIFLRLGHTLFFAMLCAWPWLSSAQDSAPPHAALLTIDGPIGPATSDYFSRAHKKAVDGGARLVIVRIDTPGGLDTAMRDIIKVILGSAIPVVAYVEPSGARAASAGTYIVYAAHIAAMAPATNLGAATPVRVGMPGADKPDPDKKKNGGKSGQAPPSRGDVMENKVLNDAVAFIRGLAERRGRNAAWAERAVREGVSLPSHDALKQKVIDLVAANLDELLLKIDGRKVETNGGSVVLATQGMLVERFEPDWRSKLLSALTSPTIAVILMMIGIYGLLFEGYSPGAIVPGVVGAICLLLALFAFQALSINYVGFALLILGIGLIIGESLVPSFGMLGFGGITAFVLGTIMLIDTDVPGYGVNRGIIGGIALAAAMLMMLTLYVVQRTRRLPSAPGGSPVMPGALAEVIEFADGRGWAWLQGERWRITSSAPLQPGQRVRVENAQGLTLRVKAFSEDSSGEDRGA